MKVPASFIVSSIAVLLLIASPSANAQSYSTIDGSIGLYCADLPDGTNAVVRVVNVNGQYNVTPVDPRVEVAALVAQRRDIQKRINSLSKIKRNYNPSSDLTKLKKVFQFVSAEIADGVEADESFDKTKPHRIFKKIGEMMVMLKGRLDDLQVALEAVERCVRNEDLIPPPQAPASGLITFSFRHPDYGSLEIMRGLGATAILHKKRIFGSLCVSFERPHGSIAIFPKESEIRIARNPCLIFFQTTFRNFPFCHYGAHQDMAVGWFGSSNVGFSQKSPDEREIKSLESKLAGFGKITVRAPTKRKPCRTGK